MLETLFGKLTIDSFIHGPIETGAQMMVVLGGVSVIAILWYTKRFRWLWKEWLTSVDAKKIGIMYLVLAGVMLFRGGVDALMMRGQQAIAVGTSNGFLEASHYDQIFTAHGVIMIFFVAMPFMFGLLNCIVPLQIGARDVAFPFLNSFSFWMTVAGAMLVNASLVIGEFAATGWLAYPPLSEMAYSPGVGVDYYIWALQIAGVGTLLAAVNFIVTIVKMRTPNMRLMNMPVFVWTSLGSMILVLFAFPILTATLATLSLDRYLGMHFFTADGGGNLMMYVNLIWAWGHPEVYILILPAFGIFSEIVPVFSAKRLFGYTSMVIATLLIVVMSFMVWLHHFFTMGAGANVNAFFGIMTMAISIPTGVKVFNWLFTMFRGRITFATPMLWFMGFLVTFTIGGMTGVLMAIPGVDFQFHNTLFLVAHFHNMIIGGVLFGFFAGLAYWWPKIFGYRLSERIGTWVFWSWIIGFVLAFIPLYVLGLMGMTRRLDHIDASTGWHSLLIVAAIGACIIAFAIFLQVVQIFEGIRNRKLRTDTTGDPWNARTLEWSTSSPAPEYNFAVIPDGGKRDAFWEMKREGKLPTLLPKYDDIHLPKNTGVGLMIAGFSFLFGFGMVWQMWWLVVVSIAGIVTSIIARSFEEKIEYTLPGSEIAKIEALKFNK